MDSLAQPLRPRIERLRHAWRSSPLPGFLRWWGQELRMCLPRRWRALFTSGAQWRLLVSGTEYWHVLAPGQAEPVGRIDTGLSPAQQRLALSEACAGIDPADLRLALCLAPQQVLRRTLQLPQAARANLHQVVGYELDRQTPFQATQVVYDTRAVGPVRGAGQIRVELVAAPRSRLDPLLRQLDAAGIGLDAVDVLHDGARLGVNLQPPGQRRRRSHPRRRTNRILGGVLLVLVLLCMFQWLANRRTVLEDMRAQVKVMHDQARAVMKLRQQLQARVGAAGFLARQRAHAPTVLAVLDDLSRRLPGDTWLQRLSIGEDGNVGMQGQSPQAARLVDLLKPSALLAEPGFQGVIQTDPRTHKERFYLTAHLQAPPAAPDARGNTGEGHAAQVR